MPIIKSRVKSFLNEIEYNREFSHTILHKFNVLKSKKDDFYTGGDVMISNYQKPIIKKEVAVKSKKTHLYVNESKENKESNKDLVKDYLREKEVKDKDIDILKKNLMKDVTPRNDDKKNGLIINPSYAIENKKNVKSSLEIEINRTPKIEHLRNVESNRNIEHKREKKESNSENHKKNIEKNIRKNVIRKSDNISTNQSSNLKESDSNITDRKKSESKSSQEENKERNAALREFMKKMKDNIKENPHNDINVIWLKGMDNFELKENKVSRKNSDRDKDQKDLKIDIRDLVKESKEIININVNINTPKITEMYNNQNKNPKYKDLKEYLETQKMLLELEKLQDGELEENDSPDDEYEGDNQEDIINEFKSLDEDALAANEKDDYFEEEEIIEVLLINKS